MAPAFEIATVAKRATIPPELPSHGYGATLAPAAMVSVAYSGTRTTCEPVANRVALLSGLVSVSVVAPALLTRASSYAPTSPVSETGVWLPDVAAATPVVCQ